MEKCALCRCGQSKNKPFCDGTHADINFNGTETADLEQCQSSQSRAKEINGPELILKDVEKLCASARFCHYPEKSEGGIKIAKGELKDIKGRPKRIVDRR